MVKQRQSVVTVFRSNDYEYEIFSILISAHAWTSLILAGKRDRRRHYTTSFSATTTTNITTTSKNDRFNDQNNSSARESRS